MILAVGTDFDADSHVAVSFDRSDDPVGIRVATIEQFTKVSAGKPHARQINEAENLRPRSLDDVAAEGVEVVRTSRAGIEHRCHTAGRAKRIGIEPERRMRGKHERADL